VAADRTPAETVRALYDAFARRDVGAAIALAHPELEFWPHGTAERARRGESYRGHDGLREYFADVERVWDELRVEPDELRVAGDAVVAFGTAVGRTRGQEVRQQVIWVWKLREGRVLSGRVVPTAAAAAAAAGLAD
jgi:ketosteroid isomerase-like protein